MLTSEKRPGPVSQPWYSNEHNAVVSLAFPGAHAAGANRSDDWDCYRTTQQQLSEGPLGDPFHELAKHVHGVRLTVKWPTPLSVEMGQFGTHVQPRTILMR